MTWLGSPYTPVAEDAPPRGSTYSPSIISTDSADSSGPPRFKFLPLEALTPTPGTERSFIIKNNKFAFSPGQLSKLLNPKNHQAFYACGGLDGLENGLMTDRRLGLPLDERRLNFAISFHDVAPNGTAPWGRYKPNIPAIDEPESTTQLDLDGLAEPFADRKAVFGTHSFPTREAISAKEILTSVTRHRSIVLLATAAVFAVALII